MKKAFTLVEMLGVIVIISIIILVAYPAISNSLKKVQNEIDKGTLDVLYSATNSFIKKDQNNYPLTENETYCIPLNSIINSGDFSKDSISSQLMNGTMSLSDSVNASVDGYIYDYDYTPKATVLTCLHAGFVNLTTGTIETNTTYPNSLYTDYLFVEAGKTYTLTGHNYDFRYRIYNIDYSYARSITAGGSNSYSFTPSNDGYVRVLLFAGLQGNDKKDIKLTVN